MTLPDAADSDHGRSPAETRRVRGIRSKSGARQGDARLAWVLILPSVIGFGAFSLYPALRGLYFSFTDYGLLAAPKWTGLDNYIRMAHDDTFWHSLGVTVYFVILSVALTMGLSIGTAVVLHRVSKSSALRGIVILPFLISSVVAAVVWGWILDAQFGIVNIVIRALGGSSIQFLSDSNWVIPVLALITVWKTFGYTTILVFAGLQTIPATVYEAGRIDGASEIQMFRRITLPLLRPIIAMVLVLTVISSFQVFDVVSVTTKGGPANASLVLPMYIYDKAFGQFDFGYASTMSIALFVMLLALSFVQMRMLRASETETN
ncbi:carbohydrate ABC transporter permease [Streptomyces sp. NPDC002920]